MSDTPIDDLIQEAVAAKKEQEKRGNGKIRLPLGLAVMFLRMDGMFEEEILEELGVA